MKKTSKILITLVILCFELSSYAAQSTTVIELPQSKFKLETRSDGAVSISYSGYDFAYPIGDNAPALPLLSLNVPLPANSSFESCSVQVVDKVRIKSNAIIAAAPTGK